MQGVCVGRVLESVGYVCWEGSGDVGCVLGRRGVEEDGTVY